MLRSSLPRVRARSSTRTAAARQRRQRACDAEPDRSDAQPRLRLLHARRCRAPRRCRLTGASLTRRHSILNPQSSSLLSSSLRSRVTARSSQALKQDCGGRAVDARRAAPWRSGLARAGVRRLRASKAIRRTARPWRAWLARAWPRRRAPAWPPGPPDRCSSRGRPSTNTSSSSSALQRLQLAQQRCLVLAVQERTRMGQQAEIVGDRQADSNSSQVDSGRAHEPES